jgi:hypothetical protein
MIFGPLTLLKLIQQENHHGPKQMDKIPLPATIRTSKSKV